MYREIHTISPLHLTHPGWHLLNTHIHRVTHSWRQMPYPGAVGSHSQDPFTGPREQCLAQGHLGCGKAVDCHPSSYQFTNHPRWDLNPQSLASEASALLGAPDNYYTLSEAQSYIACFIKLHSVQTNCLCGPCSLKFWARCK